MMAHNYMTGVDVPVEEAVHQEGTRWFIKPGFAGFNSRANNYMGYATKAKAEAAVLKYQSK